MGKRILKLTEHVFFGMAINRQLDINYIYIQLSITGSMMWCLFVFLLGYVSHGDDLQEGYVEKGGQCSCPFDRFVEEQPQGTRERNGEGVFLFHSFSFLDSKYL